MKLSRAIRRRRFPPINKPFGTATGSYIVWLWTLPRWRKVCLLLSLQINIYPNRFAWNSQRDEHVLRTTAWGKFATWLHMNPIFHTPWPSSNRRSHPSFTSIENHFESFFHCSICMQKWNNGIKLRRFFFKKLYHEGYNFAQPENASEQFFNLRRD
jgi:hypothetical protein